MLEEKSDKYFVYDQIYDVFGKEIGDFIYRADEEDGTYGKGMRLKEGITKEYTRYDKVSVIFGIKEEYYDFSF